MPLCQDVLKCAMCYTVEERYWQLAKVRLFSHLKYSHAVKVMPLAWASQKLTRTSISASNSIHYYASFLAVMQHCV